MFGLLKQRNPHEQPARDVYAQIAVASRAPVFYRELGVADSFEGRFDLLALHLFMVMEASGDEAFNQALFDEAFGHMELALRELSIGDIGIPKHMQKMMKAFNGRMHAYSEGEMGEALKRNLYGGGDVPEAMAAYVARTREALAGKDIFKDDLFEVPQ